MKRSSVTTEKHNPKQALTRHAAPKKLAVNLAGPRKPKKGCATGPKGISDDTLARALRNNGGVQASAARVLRIDRTTVCERVGKNPMLQQAMAEGKEQIIDVAQDNVIVAIRKRNPEMTRWFLGRQATHLGYGFKADVKDVTPVDPEASRQRNGALALVLALVEERARNGLPPLFSGPEPTMTDITPPRGALATTKDR